MSITASRLRANIYRVLDKVIETGEPVEITRQNHRLKIVADKPRSKLARLTKRPCIKGDPESIVHVDWSTEWKP